MAYERVGEFGRAQWILAFVTCVARNANSYFTHTFAFLVLQQKYLCLKSGNANYVSCSIEHICDSPGVKFKTDKHFSYYIDNWFSDMPSLKCMTEQQIGFMITAYFVGYAANALFSTMPDKYGRKRSTYVSMICSCVA